MAKPSSFDLKATIAAIAAVDEPINRCFYAELGDAWVFKDGAHFFYSNKGHVTRHYQCEDLEDALSCLVQPPSKEEWDENLKEQEEG